jgi:hypothetical protein
MAPEQLAGKGASVRSDIYARGVDPSERPYWRSCSSARHLPYVSGLFILFPVQLQDVGYCGGRGVLGNICA